MEKVVKFEDRSYLQIGLTVLMSENTSTVLVADDEPKIVTLIKLELQQEGFTVVTASDGVSALEVLRSSPPDIALLDWNMEGITGLEICRRLRETGVLLPVIMITCRDEIDDRVAALETGADDYICKPFNIRELLARVKSLIRRSCCSMTDCTTSDHASSNMLQVGDLNLNGTERTCSINGNALALTVREFDLLECFMRHPRHALSRAQLIQHVWGDDYFGDEHVVDTYVRYLRKKLEDTGSNRLIHTVRGVGFALRVDK